MGVPTEPARTIKLDIADRPRVAIMFLLLPLIVWVWLCRDWPARLGFYSDDWMILLHPFVGTAEAFRDIARGVATRPVSVPFIWLAQVIVDWSPVRSQILNAVMLLVTAASVGMLAAALSSVVRGLREAALVGACIASAVFIVFPSNVGTFAWGVGVTTVIPALPLFCLATSLLLRAEGSWWRLGVGLTAALLSHLSYEAFYFQEITFVLIATALRGGWVRDIPWRVIIGAVLVNVGSLAFNRMTSEGVQKTFHWDFVQVFVGGYSRILHVLGHAVREYDLLIATSVVVAGLAGGLCLARFVGFMRVQIALLVTICGIVAAGFLYAFAGYGFAAEGPMARVGIVLATYYAIGSGVLAAAAWRADGWYRLPAVAFFLFAATSLVALTLTARSRANEWADTWSYEVSRLSRLPASIASTELSAGAGQRIYLAIEDRAQSFVEPATAPWEIAGAVAWKVYKITNSRLLMVDTWHGSRTAPRWFATEQDWFNRWSGDSFEQGPCSSSVAITSNPGSELWSWRTSTSELTKIEAPWEFGCH